MEEEKGTCLKDCIAYMFNIPEENIENFIEYEDWIERFVKYMNDLGYIVHMSDSKDVSEEDIPNDIYLVWGTSRRGNYHSVIHKKGHLYYDSPIEITEKDNDFIVDKFHPTCDKWMFGVKDVYEYVWFEKKNKNVSS
jgi:hypothetical protein